MTIIKRYFNVYPGGTISCAFRTRELAKEYAASDATHVAVEMTGEIPDPPPEAGSIWRDDSTGDLCIVTNVYGQWVRHVFIEGGLSRSGWCSLSELADLVSDMTQIWPADQEATND